jgi:hypothetical protein
MDLNESGASRPVVADVMKPLSARRSLSSSTTTDDSSSGDRSAHQSSDHTVSAAPTAHSHLLLQRQRTASSSKVYSQYLSMSVAQILPSNHVLHTTEQM